MTSLSQRSHQSVCHGVLFCHRALSHPNCPRAVLGGQRGSVVNHGLALGPTLETRLKKGYRGARPWGNCVTRCGAVWILFVCMGEATPEDDPGEGKHKKRKTQSNSSIFFPTSDMMASNRSMHTNPKCQKVCMFVTKMCFFLSLRENDIWQFNLATKALPSFLLVLL